MGAGAAALACKDSRPKPAPLQGKIMGNDAVLGHRLRQGKFPNVSSTIKRQVLIVGGGIAGLSAAWRLAHAGITDVEMVEMAPKMGGTARSGENRVSQYPWGAHYVPVPNKESKLALRLYTELGLVSGRDTNGQPIFNARHLVFEPEDRLFYRGKWYEGLYLEAGASQDDTRQFEAFLKFTNELRTARGKDGRIAFAIPTALSSSDPAFTQFDRVTMAAFLKKKGWNSPRLRWYVDYACRDDYGAGASEVSAWAALHYFAGRRPYQTGQTAGTHYFTWPQGNDWVAKRLLKSVPRSRLSALAFRVSKNGHVEVFDAESEKSLLYEAEHVILATPNHITEKLTNGARKHFAKHAPWLVANVTLRARPFNSTGGWNNVSYDSQALGYVDSTHQQFGKKEQAVWTWYQALPVKERIDLLTLPWTVLAKRVKNDLVLMHGNMDRLIERIDVWRWGHGTIIPAPGVISGDPRRNAQKTWGQVRLAHTDLSGLPLIEEANYRGVLAAEDILRQMKIKFETWATRS